MNKILVLVAVMVINISACNTTTYSDVGYGDGYSTGYNSMCAPQETPVLGLWGNDGYSLAYDNGKIDGQVDCRNGRKVKVS